MSTNAATPLNKAALADGAGRTVLVTGGTTGIGRMIAEGFAATGAAVIICARNVANCERVSAEITAKGGGRCTGFPVDLSTMAGVDALVAFTGAQADSLHCLVNCAGTPLIAPIDEYPEAGWDQVFDLNLKSAFFLVQRLLPLLRRGGTPDWPAAILNIGSIAGYRIQQRENYAYAASKAGLHFLTQSLAKHLGPDRITVNAIAPGLFLTEMTQEHAGSFAEQFIQRTPVRRLGEAHDVADLACFLASPSASFVTGLVIPLDGGVNL